MRDMDGLTAAVLVVRQCGCYYETAYDVTGREVLVTGRTCSKCFDEFFAFLERELIDRDAQLTLGLPSRRTPEGEAER